MNLVRLARAYCAVAAAILFGAAMPARAQDAASPPSFKFTPINVPKSFGTRVYGFAANDTLVGSFYDSSFVMHGFTKTTAGIFKTFDLKGVQNLAGTAIQAMTAAGTLAQATINTAGGGQIIASYFIDPTGKYTQISVPNATQTYAWSMNKAGTIVGSFLAADNVTTEAFIYQAGKYTIFQQPGMVYTSYNGINSYGVIVGDYLAKSGSPEVGFILKGGKMKLVEYKGVLETILQGINNAGTVVGYVRDPASGRNSGFVYESGVFTNVNVGVPDLVWGWAIDSKGNIAGTDVSISANIVGFLGTLK